MYRFNILKYIHNYIFRYIPWIFIGFLIAFIIPGCSVKALELNTYTLPTSNAFDIAHIYGSSSETLSYSVNNSPVYAAFLTSAITNNSITIAHGLNIFLYSDLINELLKYDNFSFIIGSNATFNNVITFVHPIGICTMNSTTSDLINNDDFVGYNFNIVNCKVNKNFNSSYSEIRLPFTISTYNSSTATRFYLSRVWNVWNDDTFNQTIIEQQQQTNNKLDEMNDNITSSDVDTGALDDTKVNNDNGVISSILTLPVRFFQNLVNSTSSANVSASSREVCQGITFQLPFVNNVVTLPCGRELLNRMNALSFYETVGGIAGGLCMFYYLIHLGKRLSDMMTLKETRAEWGGL